MLGQFLILLPLGLLVGTFGTLIGAGGGFILVPVLLLLYPEKSPETITSISLAVVFFNALSGSAAYSRMKRIDYRSGLIFAIAAVPGSILGAFTTSLIPRKAFDILFGLLLVILSVYLFIRQKRHGEEQKKETPRHHITRTVTDAQGIQYTYSYNPVTGVVVSVLVGYLSSLLGIGGGIIHVPFMIHVLGFPVHLATATSHFILAVMSFSGTITHIAAGTLSKGVLQTVALSAGVLLGAQIGARLSNKLRGIWIIRGLAIALALVGVRLLLLSLA